MSFEEPDEVTSDSSSTSSDRANEVSEAQAISALAQLEDLFDDLEEEEPTSLESGPASRPLSNEELETLTRREIAETVRGASNDGDAERPSASAPVSYLELMLAEVSNKQSLYPHYLSRGQIGNAHINATVVTSEVIPDCSFTR